MKEYSFTEARQHFASVLDEAQKEGVVCIRKKDGQLFYIKPVLSKNSPLDIEGVDLNLSLTEINDAIRDSRLIKEVQ